MYLRGGSGFMVWLATDALLLLLHLCLTGAYDPMDPNGNITIKWDFQQFRDDGYTVMIDIYNYQLYRHIDSPGWKLGWTWGGDEVIWDARGAEATEQGNCSKFIGNIPHCCDKSPIIVDLLPGAPYNMQTKNCCIGGVLSSLVQDHSNYHSSFQISVGTWSTGISLNVSDPKTPKPYSFSLGVPGYTCSNATVAPPTKFQSDGGRRKTQALYDTGVFWGIKYYNDMLLQQGEFGNVQTEILLKKEPGVFTFQGGWPFPRKISFNGEECIMPRPDEYPSLPLWSTSSPPLDLYLSSGLALLMCFIVFLLI